MVAALLLLAACGDNLRVGADAGVPDAPGVVTLAADQVTTTLDPYGVAPLAAVVTVRGVEPATVRSVAITVAGLDGEDLTVTLPYDTAYATRYACPELLHGERAVQVPVLGLYASLDNQVHVELATDAVTYAADLTITTGSLPAELPTVEIVWAERALMEPGWNLAGFSSAANGYLAQPFIYDHFGRIRWVLLAYRAVGPGFLTPLELLADGNLVFGTGDAVYELSLLGREVDSWVLPEGFIQDHDVAEMPDGSLLVCGHQRDATIVTGGGETVGGSDQVVEIDRRTGAVRNLWDLRQLLDVDRYAYLEAAEGADWLHLNSVVYVPADDTIVVSGRHQGVAAVTRGGLHLDDPAAGKELRWILAPHTGWGRAGPDGTGIDLQPFLLTAVDEAGVPLEDEFQEGTASRADFGWPFGQHAAEVLPDGSVFMFDNGAQRDLGHFDGPPFSRAVAYRVAPDPSGVGGTVRQVWEYGRERPSLYAPIVSNVAAGEVAGTRFFMPGSLPHRMGGVLGGTFAMVEVRLLDGRVVFEAHLHTTVSNGDICYRQGRVPLYAR